MASPPYTHSPTALSPPSSQSFGMPSSNRKRASDAGGGIATPSLKRRKASAMSVSSAASHPLRQTSFPPDETSFYSGLGGARSPSVDSMSLVSGSQVSAAMAAPKKKRGRKSKAEKAREMTPSVVGGPARTVVSGVSDGRGGSRAPGGGDGAAGNADEEEENMELDRAEVTVAATAQETTEEQKEEETRLRNMLVNAFSAEQFDRYENWRASGLTKTTVRKLVNATVSQSVPENIVLTVRTAVKLFLGDLIESARRVQGEWIEKTGEKQVETGLLTPEPSQSHELARPPGGGAEDDAVEGEDRNEDEDEAVRKRHRRGPLRPDHLFEALRRYKLANEGGNVGLHQPWHQQQSSGVERFSTRVQGRRLFK